MCEFPDVSVHSAYDQTVPSSCSLIGQAQTRTVHSVGLQQFLRVVYRLATEALYASRTGAEHLKPSVIPSWFVDSFWPQMFSFTAKT